MTMAPSRERTLTGGSTGSGSFASYFEVQPPFKSSSAPSSPTPTVTMTAQSAAAVTPEPTTPLSLEQQLLQAQRVAQQAQESLRLLQEGVRLVTRHLHSSSSTVEEASLLQPDRLEALAQHPTIGADLLSLSDASQMIQQRAQMASQEASIIIQDVQEAQTARRAAEQGQQQAQAQVVQLTEQNQVLREKLKTSQEDRKVLIRRCKSLLKEKEHWQRVEQDSAQWAVQQHVAQSLQWHERQLLTPRSRSKDEDTSTNATNETQEEGSLPGTVETNTSTATAAATSLQKDQPAPDQKARPTATIQTAAAAPATNEPFVPKTKATAVESRPTAVKVNPQHFSAASSEPTQKVASPPATPKPTNSTSKGGGGGGCGWMSWFDYYHDVPEKRTPKIDNKKASTTTTVKKNKPPPSVAELGDKDERRAAGRITTPPTNNNSYVPLKFSTPQTATDVGTTDPAVATPSSRQPMFPRPRTSSGSCGRRSLLSLDEENDDNDEDDKEDTHTATDGSTYTASTLTTTSAPTTPFVVTIPLAHAQGGGSSSSPLLLPEDSPMTDNSNRLLDDAVFRSLSIPRIKDVLEEEAVPPARRGRRREQRLPSSPPEIDRVLKEVNTL